MYKCEEIFSEIVNTKETRRISLSDAVLAYAEEADCDVVDVIKNLDVTAVGQIRESLKCSDLLKPSLRSKPTPQVLFE